MSRRILLSVIVAVALVAGIVAGIMLSGIGAAQPNGSGNIPQLMNYQGTLRDSEGDLVNGPTEFEFHICDAESGGAILWGEVHTVWVEDGLVSVLLSIDASVFEGDERWLEIIVEEEVLPPRQRLASVPYAFQAENAQTLQGEPASAFLEVSGGTMTGPLHVDNLYVEGIITMSPTTRAYSVPACAFLPGSSATQYGSSPAGLISYTGESTTFFAPVYLPYWAEVIALWAWVWDWSDSEDIHVSLDRYNHNDDWWIPGTEMAHVKSTGEDSNVQVLWDLSIDNGEIDLLNYKYALTATLESGGITNAIGSVLIWYSIDRPLP